MELTFFYTWETDAEVERSKLLYLYLENKIVLMRMSATVFQF